jgi:hypothetical protein
MERKRAAQALAAGSKVKAGPNPGPDRVETRVGQSWVLRVLSQPAMRFYPLLIDTSLSATRRL